MHLKKGRLFSKNIPGNVSSFLHKCFLELYSVYRWCGRQSVDLRTLGKQVGVQLDFSWLHLLSILCKIAYCPDNLSVFEEASRH